MTLARRSMPTVIPLLAARMRARAWALTVALIWSVLAFVPVARADDLQDVSKLVASGKLDDAEKRADAYLKQSPKDAQMRFLKGVILSQRGKRDEAVAVFIGLTQDYPELPEPYNNLAVIYAAQGQYDKARDALETALRVAPNDATAYENLGDVYAALAARSYRTARRYDPNNAASLRKLDAVRALLTGPGAAGAPAAAAPTPAVSSAPAAPDPRAQRNVGMARPAGPPATVIGFGAEPPEIVVPSVGTAVPQGSNVVAVGTPDSDTAVSTAALTGATTVVPIAPTNPIPAINVAVQRWAASRSLKTGELNIRVDGDTAIARFREETKNARKSIARSHALTLRRNGADWTVTDDKVES